ncbi:MAG: formylglycine-generating enzyme family protein [Saprospiraceae bacterium]
MPQQQTSKSRVETEHLGDGVCIDLVEVKGGAFMMGEGKDHKVIVPDFFLGKYPVTNAQYLAFVVAAGAHAPEWMEEGNEYNIYTGTSNYYKDIGEALTAPTHPVVGVSWHDAVAFCDWLSAQSGKIYRLPSEAEWEYAAGGGQQSLGFPYAGSHELKEAGWFSKNSHGATKPVGLKLPNELGLYDMSGNVWEWCADYWHDDYENAPRDGSAWTAGGDDTRRVVRGGSWFSVDDLCRVSGRFNYYADLRYYIIGFRLARY